MHMIGRRRAEQRARPPAAEAEAFAHHGVDPISEPLALAESQLPTRVVLVGSGPPILLLHGSAMTATVWAPLLPHLSGRCPRLVDLPGCGLADAFDHRDHRFDYRGVGLATHQTTFVG